MATLNYHCNDDVYIFIKLRFYRHTIADECTTRLCNFNDRIATTVNLEQVDILIRRYLSNGQYKTALFWADKRLALSRRKKRPPSLVDVAEFIKVYYACIHLPIS